MRRQCPLLAHILQPVALRLPACNLLSPYVGHHTGLYVHVITALYGLSIWILVQTLAHVCGIIYYIAVIWRILWDFLTFGTTF